MCDLAHIHLLFFLIICVFCGLFVFFFSFSIELPAYSSAALLHRRLLYAITNCVAIDQDNTLVAQQAGRMAAESNETGGSMGGEEEEEDEM